NIKNSCISLELFKSIVIVILFSSLNYEKFLPDILDEVIYSSFSLINSKDNGSIFLSSEIIQILIIKFIVILLTFLI
ncbi:hypothetical protein ACOL22_12945, partial [Aliarcobacter butzleri]